MESTIMELKNLYGWLPIFVVEIFEKDHFKKSIEEDEGKDETIS